MPSVCKNKVIVGSLRHTPVLGAYHATNVTITGSGTIDGQGQPWWENCTKCHYPPGNEPRFCVNATRPKLIETQFVTGFRVLGAAAVTQPETARTGPPAGMERCRVTTAAFELKKSDPVPGVHGAYDAFTPATIADQGPTKHPGEYCGRQGGASGHAALAFASDNDTLAQCSAKCTELGCTCYDYLSSLLPPGPPPFDWSRTLTLQNSPFWTLTPSYSEQIHVRDLRILAPMDRIGNTDGVNIDSSRDVLVENVYIKNSDDGVCIKSGLERRLWQWPQPRHPDRERAGPKYYLRSGRSWRLRDRLGNVGRATQHNLSRLCAARPAGDGLEAISWPWRLH
jgi:hypothetical protein